MLKQAWQEPTYDGEVMCKIQQGLCDAFVQEAAPYCAEEDCRTVLLTTTPDSGGVFYVVNRCSSVGCQGGGVVVLTRSKLQGGNRLKLTRNISGAGRA